ncbi:hypothetical protein B0H10DRAFT_1970368 [Mycena sp. CBHHK59/15]|nr:hypothetical protein B0H10DRAFT_1970368 [Mycena sp. CBHHK59/15]
MEHNLLASSKIYNNITFRGLGALLDLTPGAAETMARKMIEQDRLRGSINQVDKLIWFKGSREEDDIPGKAGGLGDVEEAEDMGAPLTKHWDMQIRLTAANVHMFGLLPTASDTIAGQIHCAAPNREGTVRFTPSSFFGVLSFCFLFVPFAMQSCQSRTPSTGGKTSCLPMHQPTVCLDNVMPQGNATCGRVAAVETMGIDSDRLMADHQEHRVLTVTRSWQTIRSIGDKYGPFDAANDPHEASLSIAPLGRGSVDELGTSPSLFFSQDSVEALGKASPLTVVSLAVVSVSDDCMDRLCEENSPDSLPNDPLANDPQEASLSLIHLGGGSMDGLREASCPAAPSPSLLFSQDEAVWTRSRAKTVEDDHIHMDGHCEENSLEVPSVSSILIDPVVNDPQEASFSLIPLGGGSVDELQASPSLLFSQDNKLHEKNSPEAPSVSPLLNGPLTNDPQKASLSLVSLGRGSMDELRHLGLEALWKASPLAVVSLAVISVSDDRMDGLTNDLQEANLSLISFGGGSVDEPWASPSLLFSQDCMEGNHMDGHHEENSPEVPSVSTILNDPVANDPQEASLSLIPLDGGSELHEASSPQAPSPSLLFSQDSVEALEKASPLAAVFTSNHSMDELREENSPEASSPSGPSVPPLLSIAEGKVDIPQAKTLQEASHHSSYIDELQDSQEPMRPIALHKEKHQLNKDSVVLPPVQTKTGRKERQQHTLIEESDHGDDIAHIELIDLTSLDACVFLSRDMMVKNLSVGDENLRPPHDLQGIHIPLFAINSTTVLPVKTCNFHAFARLTKSPIDPNLIEFYMHVEYHMIEQILTYFLGDGWSTILWKAPKYWLESARSTIYTEGCSIFFTTNRQGWWVISPSEKQTVFKDHHILIKCLNTGNLLKFKGDPFERMGIPLIHPIEIHDLTERTANAIMDGLKVGDVMEFLKEAGRPDGKVLNMHLRLDGVTLSFNTNKAALLHTRRMPGCQWTGKTPLEMHTKWAVASTENATTTPCSNEFATVVMSQSGSRLWFMSYSGTNLPGASFHGRMYMMHAYTNWHPFSSCTRHGGFEGCLLEPGDVLIMQPNTQYYSVAVSARIIQCRNFHALSTVLDSIWSYFHKAMLGPTLTNAAHGHEDAYVMFIQMFAYWFTNRGYWTTTTWKGLLQMVSLSNLIILLEALDYRFYLDLGTNSIDRLTPAQISAEPTRRANFRSQLKYARIHFAAFRTWFKVSKDREPVEIEEDIFHKSVIHMVTVLTFYKKANLRTAPMAKGWTLEMFQERLTGRFTDYSL